MIRKELEALVLRHGEMLTGPANIAGGKPSYEEFVAFYEGKLDPPIDVETTTKLLIKALRDNSLQKDCADIIIYSPTLRTKQTAELIKEIIAPEATTHPSKYLRDVHMPMDDIDRELYQKAKNIPEIREHFTNSFLQGKKVDEDVVEVYRRAEQLLKYFKRIKKNTEKKPLFVTHGFFSRILQLAILHANQKLNDDDCLTLVQREFYNTKRPGPAAGFTIKSFSNDAVKVLEME